MPSPKSRIAQYLFDRRTIGNRLLPERLLDWLEIKLRPDNGDTYYGARASDYNAVRLQQAHWHEENKIVENLIDNIPELTTVLDVPCGTGRFFEFFSRKNLAVTGMDLSAEMLAEAARVLNGLDEDAFFDLRRGSATQMPFADSSFDLVVCVRFLRAIVSFGDAKKVIAEVARVSSRWAIFELDIRPEGKSRRSFPSDRVAMRDKLYMEEMRTLLSDYGLNLVSAHPLQTKGSSQFVLLAEKISD
jgi:SAM-dependent methyltransferase